MQNLGCENKCECSNVKMFRTIYDGTLLEYYVNEMMKYDNLSDITKLIIDSVVESILTYLSMDEPFDDRLDEEFDKSEEEFEDE